MIATQIEGDVSWEDLFQGLTGFGIVVLIIWLAIYSIIVLDSKHNPKA